MHASVETKLSDERIVVIGGSSAIGIATVQAVVKHGGQAIVTKRPGEPRSLEVSEENDGASVNDEEHTEEGNEKETGNRYRDRIEEYELDSTDEEAVEAFFDEVDAFDHLVCATSYGPSGGALEIDAETLRDVFDVLFWGRYYAAKHSREYLDEGGSITFVSGNAASRPSVQFFASGVSNAAVETLTKYLAVEMGPVRVNAISPGRVDTLELEEDTQRTLAESLPAKHIGEPADIADVILFSVTNPHVSGTVIRVDGGDLLV
jgi:NAD(P)-dependent dehydrogenase (short-subunit alcohol dehydrogenase family)